MEPLIRYWLVLLFHTNLTYSALSSFQASRTASNCGDYPEDERGGESSHRFYGQAVDQHHQAGRQTKNCLLICLV